MLLIILSIMEKVISALPVIKPRAISPKPDPTKTAQTDIITITSSRWYQHYGVQGSMLSGHGGFEFQGYNYTKFVPYS